VRDLLSAVAEVIFHSSAHHLLLRGSQAHADNARGLVRDLLAAVAEVIFLETLSQWWQIPSQGDHPMEPHGDWNLLFNLLAGRAKTSGRGNGIGCHGSSLVAACMCLETS